MRARKPSQPLLREVRETAAKAYTATRTGTNVWWKREIARAGLPLSSVLAADPLERVALIRAGVPADVVPLVADRMGISIDRMLATLGLPRATVARKLRAGARLSLDESERVLGLVRLIAETERVVSESGDPANFDAARAVATWLDSPVPALGNRRPAELMDTAEGREIVVTLVGQMQASAYL